MKTDDQRDVWRQQMTALAACATGIDIGLLMMIYRAAQATADAMHNAQQAGVDITPVVDSIGQACDRLALEKIASISDFFQMLEDLGAGDTSTEGENHGR